MARKKKTESKRVAVDPNVFEITEDEIRVLSLVMDDVREEFNRIADTETDGVRYMVRIYCYIQSIEDPKKRFVAFMIYNDLAFGAGRQSVIDELKEAGHDLETEDDDSDKGRSSGGGGNGVPKSN